MSSPFLKDLRDLRVLVCHPEDREGEELVRHVRRIGCHVETLWPPPDDDFASWVDVVILSVTADLRAWLRKVWQSRDGDGPSLIAVVDYENPTTLQTVLELNAHAVIGKPIRPFGLLTNLVVARQAHSFDRRLKERIQKLESKLRSVRVLNEAKSVLMGRNGITEDEAYRLIRSRAMSKRVSTEEIARSILNAEDLLQSGDKTV